MLLQALLVPASKPFTTAQQHMSHGSMQHKLLSPLRQRRHRRKELLVRLRLETTGFPIQNPHTSMLLQYIS